MTWVAGGIMIRKPLNTMATDSDIESILSNSNTFCNAPEISFAASAEDIMQAVIKYSESGIPCVITGFPLDEDGKQSPFHQSRGWMESMYASRGARIPGVSFRCFLLKPYSL